MIVFDLLCDEGHRFEGWFGSSAEFERQQGAGFVACPQCGSVSVGKAVMAPAIGRKGNQLPAAAPQSAQPTATAVAKPVPMTPVPMTRTPLPPEAVQMMRALAQMQTKALEQSRWVGGSFAEDARAMHYGERDHETIHGQATAEEATALIEEGIAVMPLPFPVVPPGEAN
jgi:hypothetical protein